MVLVSPNFLSFDMDFLLPDTVGNVDKHFHISDYDMIKLLLHLPFITSIFKINKSKSLLNSIRSSRYVDFLYLNHLKIFSKSIENLEKKKIEILFMNFSLFFFYRSYSFFFD